MHTHTTAGRTHRRTEPTLPELAPAAPLLQQALHALRLAEDRLTLRAEDERDIQVLQQMRAVLAAADH